MCIYIALEDCVNFLEGVMSMQINLVATFMHEFSFGLGSNQRLVVWKVNKVDASCMSPTCGPASLFATLTKQRNFVLTFCKHTFYLGEKLHTQVLSVNFFEDQLPESVNIKVARTLVKSFIGLVESYLKS